MEIVMQWLDELDDLYCAGLFMWRRLCRSSLCIGLFAALLLPVIGIAQLEVVWFAALSATALSSVIAWTVAFILSITAAPRPQPV